MVTLYKARVTQFLGNTPGVTEVVTLYKARVPQFRGNSPGVTRVVTLCKTTVCVSVFSGGSLAKAYSPLTARELSSGEQAPQEATSGQGRPRRPPRSPQTRQCRSTGCRGSRSPWPRHPCPQASDPGSRGSGDAPLCQAAPTNSPSGHGGHSIGPSDPRLQQNRLPLPKRQPSPPNGPHPLKPVRCRCGRRRQRMLANTVGNVRRHRLRNRHQNRQLGPTMTRRCDDVQGCVSVFVPFVL